jgi:hypothetical protein
VPGVELVAPFRRSRAQVEAAPDLSRPREGAARRLQPGEDNRA